MTTSPTWPLRHQRKACLILVVLLAMVARASDALADNPIVQTIYTADPAPMVHEGRLYVYSGHDEDVLVDNFFTMNEWRVYSTADMVNWTDHGAPLRYTDFAWAKSNAWAGQTIYRNGKFYFYTTTAQGIGVATSTSPVGPFKDALGKALIMNSGCGDIDPTVFIDDDGQAYLYWGNPNCCYVKLNQDMISYTGGVVKIPMTTESFGVRSKTDRATSYEEAPWLYKRGSLYYLVFAGGPISEHIAYATGPSATGPWTYRGVIMTPQGSSFTNHPGIAEYSGNSYFVYHNGALPDGGGYHRSVAVEKFSYNSDGTIPSLKMSTAGAPALGGLNPFVTTEAETIAWEVGVETEPCAEGGMNLASISNGDYVKISRVDFASGATGFNARVASKTAGGSIELVLDSLTGTRIGSCPVGSTGDEKTWATITCPVTEVTGIHDLYLKFVGGSGDLFKFNWWKFTGPGVGTIRDGGVFDVSRETGATGGGSGTGGTETGTGGTVGTGGKGGAGGRSSAAAISGAGALSSGTASAGGASRSEGGMKAGGGISNGGEQSKGGGAGSGAGMTASNGGVSSSSGISSSGAAGPLGSGGRAPTGSQSTARPTSDSGGGCSCHVGAKAAGTRAGWSALFGLMLSIVAVRRRRLSTARSATCEPPFVDGETRKGS